MACKVYTLCVYYTGGAASANATETEAPTTRPSTSEDQMSAQYTNTMEFHTDLFPDTLPKLIDVHYSEDDSTADRFHRFHEANPQVYNAIKSLSKAMKRRGLEVWSMRAAFAVIRFASIATNSDSDYKLNDHYSPFYSRMIQSRVPELKDFFNTKPCRADGSSS